MRNSKRGQPPKGLTEMINGGTVRLDDARLLSAIRRGRVPIGVSDLQWVALCRRVAAAEDKRASALKRITHSDPDAEGQGYLDLVRQELESSRG